MKFCVILVIVFCTQCYAQDLGTIIGNTKNARQRHPRPIARYDPQVESQLADMPLPSQRRWFMGRPYVSQHQVTQAIPGTVPLVFVPDEKLLSGRTWNSQPRVYGSNIHGETRSYAPLFNSTLPNRAPVKPVAGLSKSLPTTITYSKQETGVCEYALVNGKHSYSYEMKPGQKQTFNASAVAQWKLRFKGEEREYLLEGGAKYALKKQDEWTLTKVAAANEKKGTKESIDSKSPDPKAPDGKAPDDIAALDASLQTWQRLRDECKGNYSYKTGKTSFNGSRTETHVVIKNHRVSERQHRRYSPPHRPGIASTGTPGWSEVWTEKGVEVGRQKERGPARTLDELYATAKDVMRRKLARHEKRFVSFDDSGLLKSCFYIDTTIMDDSPRNGVSIYDLQLESTE